MQNFEKWPNILRFSQRLCGTINLLTYLYDKFLFLLDFDRFDLFYEFIFSF